MNIAFCGSVDIIIFSGIILLVLVAHAALNRTTLPVSARYRTFIALAILAILVCDLISRVRVPSAGRNFNHVLAYMSNFVYFVLQPLPVSLGIMYLLSLFRERRITVKLRLLCLIPFFIGCAAMLYSIFTGFIFHIDGNNGYHRGPGMFIFAITNYSFIIPAIWLVIHHRDTVKRQVLFVIISLTLIPVIGSLLQLVQYGLITAWPSFAIALLVVFIFIEGRRSDRDYLTGLLNRQSFDARIHTRMSQFAKRGSFFFSVIDLDNFKMINDTCGHETGDEVLQVVSRTLYHSVSVPDTVARYGGDEFVMIIESDKKKVMESVIVRINEQLKRWNESNSFVFDLSLSAGYIAYDPDIHKNFEDLFRQADQMMFKAKARKKELVDDELQPGTGTIKPAQTRAMMRKRW